MSAAPAPLARQFVTGAALLVGAALASGCGLHGRDLEPGSYRAVLELAGGELPFGLDVAQEDSGLVVYVVNGDERLRVPEATATEGRLTARWPTAGSTLTAEIRGGKLRGEVLLPGTGGERQAVPFRAEAGQAWRFFEEPSTDNADVSGRWSVAFGAGDQTRGAAEFNQSFERVTGTIVTAAGDSHLVAGEVHGDELFLSRFDGTVAVLLEARVGEDGALVGEYRSGARAHETFRAVRSTDAALEASADATGSGSPASP